VVHSIIVRTVIGNHAEGLQHHVLPTDDPLRALNILREAAGLQPLAAQTLTAGEMSFAESHRYREATAKSLHSPGTPLSS
jgi:hypothetical protein